MDKKVSTDGGQGLAQNPFGALSGVTSPRTHADARAQLAQNPFGALSGVGLPPADPAKLAALRTPQSEVRTEKNRGRVDVRRETGGRGGKTVTVVDGFVGIGLPEKEQLAKKMRAACGCGGTVKDGAIEIQGDQRETVARILREAGFRPVFAGG